mmetsp:Transcript_51321/g.128795  ORF Transcript_51321/g.128795 Transcript_51321/m.128795 type:complete len:322 (+) Transcript_51321:762-1727(+)
MGQHLVGGQLAALGLGQAHVAPGAQIDGARELEVAVELATFEERHVELEALQVEDDRVGELTQAAALEHGHLAVVLLAVERVLALQRVALHVQVERLLQRALALDLEADRVELLGPPALVGKLTLGAAQLLHQRAADQALEQLLAGRLHQRLLDARAQLAQVLVHVLLHGHVHRRHVVVEVAQRREERARVHRVPLALLQEAEQPLQLAQQLHLMRVLLLLGGMRPHRHQLLGEHRHTVQLLQQRVHVAGGAQVHQAAAVKHTARLLGRVVPAALARRTGPMSRPQQLQHAAEVALVRTAQRRQQLEAGATRTLRTALGRR